ncbi:unnamed protein product [Calicophoron daubneyi]
MVARVLSSFSTSVESLAWVGTRLFCTGATGQVSEVDFLHSCLGETSLLLGSYVARCLTKIDGGVVVGNDDGFVLEYPMGEHFESPRTLLRISGKVLCIASTTSLPTVFAVGSSSGSLLVFDYAHAPDIRHTLISESTRCVIWSLLFVSGFLFSGDSNGTVNVWDVLVGGLLQSFSSHAAHVLALTATPDGFTVFSGGADALVRRYEFCKSDDETHWELSGILRGCRRDIRGLAYIPGQRYDPGSHPLKADSRFEPHRLIAVGLDARLQVLACEQSERGMDAKADAHRALTTQVGRIRSFTSPGLAHCAALPFWPASVAPSRPPPIHFVTKTTPSCDDQVEHTIRLGLLNYPEKLVLVRLAQPESNGKQKHGSKLIRLSEQPLQLAEIFPRKGMEIVTSVLSPCGHFIAYSDTARTRVLKVVLQPENPDGEVQSSVRIKKVSWEIESRTRKPATKRRYSDCSNESPDRSDRTIPDTSVLSVTSSSETDTETDDISPEEVAKFFALDQPMANDSSVVGLSTTSTADSFIISDENRNDSHSELPSAHCLAFSPDSERIIMVTRLTDELCCVSVQTGLELWRIRIDPEPDLEFHAHVLSMSRVPGPLGHMVAVGCSDGRVRLYTVSDGKHLFTCPCVQSISGHPALPITVVFANEPSDRVTDEKMSGVRFSVLYTSGQVTEWILTFVEPPESDINQSVGMTSDQIPLGFRIIPKMNQWLTTFWRKMGNEISCTLGVFHSLDYLSKNKWLIGSDRYLAILSNEEPFGRGMLRKILKNKSDKKLNYCLKICKNFESIIQAAVLNEQEIAVVTLYSAGIALNLTSPLERRQFGT